MFKSICAAVSFVALIVATLGASSAAELPPVTPYDAPSSSTAASAPAVPPSTAGAATPAVAPATTFPPLSARISVALSGLENSESLRTGRSPILIEAVKTDNLSLEQVLRIAARRNLSFLQNRWLGRSADLTFAGNLASMSPFNASLNKQDVFLIQSAALPTGPQILQQQQTLENNEQQNIQNALNGGPPPVTPTSIPPQPPPSPRSIDRETYTTYGVTFSNGGTATFNTLSSFFRARAQAAVVRTSLQDTLAAAASNYFALCQQISLLHVADIVVENANGIVRLNQGLCDSGMGTRLQLLQAKTQLAQDRQQLVSQQAQARIAAINLAVTLNLPLRNYLLPEARPLDKTTLVDPGLPVERLVKMALAERPEISQKRNQVAQQVVQAGSSLTPIIPSASYGVQSGTFFPSNDSGTTKGAQRTLQVAWQLNQVTSVLPNMASGLASARAAQYDLSNTELQVRAQVRQAYINSLAFEKNIEIAKEAALEAQEQLRIAEDRLKAGIGINIDVIQAQSTLTIALQNYVRAIYNYNAQQVALRRAIGGFTLKSVRSRLRFD
jgi:outer membrane protein TolC